MKINTLKFNQITAIVNNKELSLDLFDKSDLLFQEDSTKISTKTTRNIDRYKLAKMKQRSKSKVIDDSHIRTKNHNKNPQPA
jgi:hypothetical protein